MAIGYIPNTGEVSIGSGAGTDRSFNVLQNIVLTTDANQVNSSFSALCQTLSANACTPHFIAGQAISFSEFREATILTARSRIKNISSAQYNDACDGIIMVSAAGGTNIFNFTCKDINESVVVTVTNVASAQLNGFGIAGTTTTLCTLNIQEVTPSSTIICPFSARITLQTSAAVASTLTDGKGNVYTYLTPSTTTFSQYVTLKTNMLNLTA